MADLRLRMAQKAAKAGMWDWNLQTNESFWSDEIWELFGLDRGSCRPSYKSWLATIHPDDRAHTDKIVTEASSCGAQLNIEWRVIHPDGSVRWLMSRGGPLLDRSDRPSSYIGVVIDITDRKSMEEELQRHRENLESLVEERNDELKNTKELLQVILDNLPVAVNYADLNLQYIFTNRTHQSWWGHLPEQVVGKSVREIGGENYKTAQPYLEAALAGQRVAFEFAATYPNQVTRDIDVIISPHVGQDGTLKGLIGLLTDVTEARESQRKLIRSEEMFRSMFDNALDGILFSSPDGPIFRANPAACAMLERSEEDICRYGRDCVVDLKDPRLPEHMETRRREGKFVGELSFCRKDGTVFPVEISSALFFDTNGTERSVIFFRDLTRRQEAELERNELREELFQSQKLASLGTLVGGIAHDFNNMLQSIMGYGEILMADIDKGRAATKPVQIIMQTSHEAAELVKKFLAFGQQSQVTPEPIDLNHKIRELESLILHLPNIKHLEMNLVNHPVIIKQNSDQLGQVIMILATNASEAMPKGGVLSLSTTRVTLDENFCKRFIGAEPGAHVLLTVTDTGCGMDETTLSRIFDPFFSTKPRGNIKGQGLGLSVLRGIIQQRGGFVTCESELGKGTAVRVYFPEIEPPVTHGIQEKKVSKTALGKKILVVEDTALVAQLERDSLEAAGYRTVMASQGKEALNIFKERHDEIGLVILDILMPEMNGRDCLMEMLKIDPMVKVVVLTGYNPQSELSLEVKPYVTEFLPKPCKMSQLLDVVRMVMEG